MSKRVIAIVGPTGTGKTELSLAVAAAIDAEVVNCDSRQIYRGLDIGSAKPAAALRRQRAHHLFDVVDPTEAFDCVRYADMARTTIAAIHERGRPALLVGGTGLYLKALRYGLFPGPPRDEKLRRALAASEEAAPGSLHRALAAIDAKTAARLHPHDRLRIIRALEVQRLTGVPLSAWHDRHAFRGDELAMTVVGLDMPRPQLFERLGTRCLAMLEEGLLDEVRGLLDAGYSPALPALQSIGYREIGEYLRGRTDLDAAVERMIRATRRFAKRQTTWFRADATIHWLDASSASPQSVLRL
jgi:tRNA dimethylallyltransferase